MLKDGRGGALREENGAYAESRDGAIILGVHLGEQ